MRELLLKNQPNKRFATVEEIGGIVAFLCSPAAASITGTTIAADGGWTACAAWVPFRGGWLVVDQEDPGLPREVGGLPIWRAAARSTTICYKL